MSSSLCPTILERHVEIASGYRRMGAILRVPNEAHGVIAFAHGSGSGRFSPRNQAVARILEEAGFATLLLDLLEEDEADDRRMVFDIELLANRLRCTADWLKQQEETGSLRLGCFGASTGAAAALMAAAQQPKSIGAVVCRGGRPDLALDSLEFVTAPTLLIVGGNDSMVLDWNKQALRWLRCTKELAIVPGATHLFEEPHALEIVADMAKSWFLTYLAGKKPLQKSRVNHVGSRLH